MSSTLSLKGDYVSVTSRSDTLSIFHFLPEGRRIGNISVSTTRQRRESALALGRDLVVEKTAELDQILFGVRANWWSDIGKSRLRNRCHPRPPFPEELRLKTMCGVRLDLLWSSADEAEVTRALFAETPLEVLEAAYGRIRAESKSEVVGRLKDESPALFERVVIELLVKMLYGGS